MDSRPVEIRLEGIEQSFGSHRVLSGIDLEIRQGDMLAIIGGSGSGKTVLLQIIIGLLPPTGGRVLAADHEQKGAPLVEIAGLDEEQMDGIRRHWAVVFQKNALFSASVYENIAVWLREVGHQDEDAIRARAVSALRSVGFDPDDTLLAKERNELSGGMAKRVALARAIAMDPIVTFYDEPTTGLDPSLAFGVHDTIRNIHESPATGNVARTTLIITHDKDLLTRLQPRILMLDKGKAVIDGPYAEFAASDSPLVKPYLATMADLHGRPTDEM